LSPRWWACSTWRIPCLRRYAGDAARAWVKRRVVEPAPRTGTVLALDVSSVCVGWALFDGIDLVAYGKYRTVGEEHGERLYNFGQWLYTMLEERQPDAAIVEAPYPGRRRNSYGVLQMYFGVVLATHVRWCGREMPHDQRVAAHRIKRLLQMPKGADHESRKRQMVQEINRLYGLALKFKAKDPKKRISDDDIADAIALARAWLLLEES
jgi:Holliday junction resolvasome RuvABC endonuclease subunit